MGFKVSNFCRLKNMLLLADHCVFSENFIPFLFTDNAVKKYVS